MICDRCGQEMFAYTMSMFNTDEICLDCLDIEQAHPDYKKAVEADNEAIRDGNFNFPGIGLPPDMSGAAKKGAS